MKPTKQNFKRTMEQLNIKQIKSIIVKTWNEAAGELFREIGFEIIDERVGEEESDRIYEECYKLALA